MASSSGLGRVSLADLPLENQEQIVEHVPSKSLFSLQLVSKRFHELASSRIYRAPLFYLSYPDSPQFYREPHYRLADALQTFATSNYQYAKHIKKFCISMSENDNEETQKRIAAKYHVSEESTMLLNLTLLLMLKKATGLETFVWDVPVELSPDIYDALSRIKALQRLHIRLDVASINRLPTSPYGPLGQDFAQQVANTQYFPPAPGSVPPPAAYRAGTGLKHSKLTRMRLERRKLGKIGNLRDLRIIAVDNLDCLEQVSLGLAKSSGSLKTLSLSLSQALVRKARKQPSSNPPPPGAAMDPGEEDEGLTEPNTPDTNAPPPVVPNDADIKKEKKAQESVLARVFGFWHLETDDKKLDKSLKASAKSVELPKSGDVQLRKIRTSLQSVVENSTISTNDKAALQALIKSLNVKLDQGSVPKPPKSKSKPKELKKSTAKKPKLTGNQWTQPVPPFPQSLNDEWSSVPPPPGASGQGGSSLSKPSAGFHFGSKSKAKKPYDNMLFGGPASSSLTMPADFMDPQYLYSSSFSGSTPFNKTTPPGASLFAIPMPTYNSSSSQPPPPPPPQFGGNNNSTNSYPGSVSLFPLNNEESLFAQLICCMPPPPHQSAYDDLIYSAQTAHQDFANLQIQNSGKPSTATPTPEELGVPESDSDSSSSPDEADSSNPAAEPLTAANPTQNKADAESDMDIDMEHPDVVDEANSNDGGSEKSAMSDDETAGTAQKAGAEDTVMTESPAFFLKENFPMPEEILKKENKLTNGKRLTSADALDGIQTGEKESSPSEPRTKARNVDDIMQDYIRMTHGFSLEELSLYLVPLKPSIIARAINLSCLRRLVFYSVGPQGGFWTYYEKFLEQGNESSLRIIRTDDVSNAFARCVSKFRGLKELHLLRRPTKEFESTTTKPPAPIDDIRKYILNKHLATLESLAIENQEDDKWDLTSSSIRLIAAKGKKLKELGCSFDVANFVCTLPEPLIMGD